MVSPDFAVKTWRIILMSKITDAMREMTSMDELSQKSSSIVTVVYIVTIVSFSVKDITGLIPFVLYPVILSQFSDIPISVGVKKLKIIVFFVCAVGIWNPIINRQVILQIGTLSISSGMISFLTLILKGILALLASFYLIASTGIEQICYALRLLKVPSILVTLILITYRYISLLMQEVENMTNAYSLRAPGQHGIHISAWESFVGQLLIRSMDRAEELYQSMELRGFHGSFYYADIRSAQWKDYLYTGICITTFLICRAVNLTEFIGNLLV